MMQTANIERSKYARLWREVPGYRENSPGEFWAHTFLAQARVEPHATAIDFGCGTGRGGLALALFGRMRVTLLDFVDGCLDEDVAAACKSQADRISFVVGDLTTPCPMSAAYGFCCDVMEHIPPEDVAKVLRNIIGSAQHCFFAISTVDDVFGAKIGERLHLTVKPADWWKERLSPPAQRYTGRKPTRPTSRSMAPAWRDAAERLRQREN